MFSQGGSEKSGLHPTRGIPRRRILPPPDLRNAITRTAASFQPPASRAQTLSSTACQLTKHEMPDVQSKSLKAGSWKLEAGSWKLTEYKECASRGSARCRRCP